MANYHDTKWVGHPGVRELWLSWRRGIIEHICMMMWRNMYTLALRVNKTSRIIRRKTILDLLFHLGLRRVYP